MLSEGLLTESKAKGLRTVLSLAFGPCHSFASLKDKSERSEGLLTENAVEQIPMYRDNLFLRPDPSLTLRMTNECNSLLTMGLRDVRKISHTLFVEIPA